MWARLIFYGSIVTHLVLKQTTITIFLMRGGIA